MLCPHSTAGRGLLCDKICAAAWRQVAPACSPREAVCLSAHRGISGAEAAVFTGRCQCKYFSIHLCTWVGKKGKKLRWKKPGDRKGKNRQTQSYRAWHCGAAKGEVDRRKHRSSCCCNKEEQWLGQEVGERGSMKMGET